MKLSVVSIEKQLVRVEAEGEITMRDFRAEGPDPFETLLGASWATHRVVLDFSRVRFIDSSAIGWLMTCRRAFEQQGGMLLVHSMQPRVRQVLDVLRIGKVLPILDDVRTALAIATGSPTAMAVTGPPVPQGTPSPVTSTPQAATDAPAQEAVVPAAKSRAATSRTRRRSAA